MLPKKRGGDITVSGLKSWLHIIMQVCDSLCYLRNKTIIHNDIIKDDNVVIVRSSSVFFLFCFVLFFCLFFFFHLSAY